MKNLYTLFLLGLILQSCQTVDYLYYYDNTDVEEEIDNIPDCEGFARLVREHFLYSAKDSLFLFNIGFTEQIRRQDYRDCFLKLSNQQIAQIFGPSNTTFTNGVPAYFHDVYSIYNHQKFYLAYYQMFDEQEYPLEDMLAKSERYKKAEGYSLPQTRKFVGAIVNERCQLSKEGWKTQVFRNQRKKTVFVNSSIMFFSEKVILNDSLKCTEVFVENEIYSLFGEPHLVRNDTLFYQTITTPFMDKKKTHPEWKGKVYCVIFHPTGYKNYYKYGNLMVDPKELIGKK